MAFEVGIEGHEFSGKTSVIEILKTKYGYDVTKQPGVIRNFIKKELLSKENLNLNMIAMAITLDRWFQKEYRSKETDIIISDRTMFTAFCINASDEKSEAYVAALNSYIQIPNLVFWLRISENELKSRIRKSKFKNDTFDHLALQTKESYDEKMPKMKDVFKGTKFVEIFCDRKTPEEIAGEIHSIIVAEVRRNYPRYFTWDILSKKIKKFFRR